jgi:cbb3-type cytochrome oxidase subunit 3
MDWLTQNSGIITTVLFFSTFVLVSIWAYLPKNKNKMQENAMIPLTEAKEND